MRSEIDAMMRRLAQLYRQRMETARRIGRFKLEHNLPVDDPQREAQLVALCGALSRAASGFERLLRSLYAQQALSAQRKRIFAQRDAVKADFSRGRCFAMSFERKDRLFGH